MQKLQHLKPDLNSDTPLYLQLAQKLSLAIQQGKWQVGEALPSERDLARWLAISRVTARKALDLLVASGLVKRYQGSGTFVNQVSWQQALHLPEQHQEPLTATRQLSTAALTASISTASHPPIINLGSSYSHSDKHPRQVISGTILTTHGWLQGQIEIAADKIIAISGKPVPTAQINERQSGTKYILPGFIDLHVHGGGGKDIMEGGDAIATVARTHARFGTTALLATTVTAPQAELASVLAGLGEYCQAAKISQGSRLLGVHLEGPYVNPGKLGAQPDCARAAKMLELDHYLALAPIKVVTLAPEITGHYEIIQRLTQQGVRVQVGHSLGSYEEGVQALAQGASGFTHLFNAMTGLNHRAPGIVGAALAHAQYAELIPDLLHVHPGAMQAALRAIPRLFCVTDATAAAAMPDGEYQLGSYTVTKCQGGVRLPDGTLAGSQLTMDQALRNLVKIGLSLEDASHRLSLYPADYLGLTERGRIAIGSYADLVVIDHELQLETVYVEGESLAITNVI